MIFKHYVATLVKMWRFSSVSSPLWLKRKDFQAFRRHFGPYMRIFKRFERLRAISSISYTCLRARDGFIYHIAANRTDKIEIRSLPDFGRHFGPYARIFQHFVATLVKMQGFSSITSPLWSKCRDSQAFRRHFGKSAMIFKHFVTTLIHIQRFSNVLRCSGL